MFELTSSLFSLITSTYSTINNNCLFKIPFYYDFYLESKERQLTTKAINKVKERISEKKVDSEEKSKGKAETTNETELKISNLSTTLENVGHNGISASFSNKSNEKKSFDCGMDLKLNISGKDIEIERLHGNSGFNKTNIFLKKPTKRCSIIPVHNILGSVSYKNLFSKMKK